MREIRDDPRDAEHEDWTSTWGEDEWANAHDVRIGVCERCGLVRPLRECLDPFVVEGIVPGDQDERESWCMPCFDLRAADV